MSTQTSAELALVQDPEVVQTDSVAASPSRWAALRDRGMATAEYAVGILAAVALALVLLKVFNSDGFLKTVTNLVEKIVDVVLGLIA
jgi:hypothetical protein